MNRQSSCFSGGFWCDLWGWRTEEAVGWMEENEDNVTEEERKWRAQKVQETRLEYYKTARGVEYLSQWFFTFALMETRGCSSFLSSSCYFSWLDDRDADLLLLLLAPAAGFPSQINNQNKNKWINNSGCSVVSDPLKIYTVSSWPVSCKLDTFT